MREARLQTGFFTSPADYPGIALNEDGTADLIGPSGERSALITAATLAARPESGPLVLQTAPFAGASADTDGTLDLAIVAPYDGYVLAASYYPADAIAFTAGQSRRWSLVRASDGVVYARGVFSDVADPEGIAKGQAAPLFPTKSDFVAGDFLSLVSEAIDANGDPASAPADPGGFLVIHFLDPVSPVPTDVQPRSGIPGSTIVITGKFLQYVTDVVFAGGARGSFVFDAEEELEVTIPLGAQTGPVNLIGTKVKSSAVAPVVRVPYAVTILPTLPPPSDPLVMG